MRPVGGACRATLRQQCFSLGFAPEKYRPCCLFSAGTRRVVKTYVGSRYRIGIVHPPARGLSLGTISHGQGTAQALSEGELQGAISGIAMGITAVLTSAALPFALHALL